MIVAFQGCPYYGRPFQIYIDNIESNVTIIPNMQLFYYLAKIIRDKMVRELFDIYSYHFNLLPIVLK